MQLQRTAVGSGATSGLYECFSPPPHSTAQQGAVVYLVNVLAVC